MEQEQGLYKCDHKPYSYCLVKKRRNMDGFDVSAPTGSLVSAPETSGIKDEA
jgi:hypothetical protein